ncbi:hypothetical protein [Domibacillus robiginosus]|uniref:hypothetical protein n=1 Tax=Domibacillus robiginosus TaxID=1071054 RepID=UPI000B30693C|nr:hypothetical protein [Domibacillus robiginosus]
MSATKPINEKRIAQHAHAINAAKRANVKLLAYTSSTKADNTTLAMGPVHKATEEAILVTFHDVFYVTIYTWKWN